VFGELFVGCVMAWMIDRCKEEGEQLPFDSPPEAVKTVEFQIKANKLACKITSGSHCNRWRQSGCSPCQKVGGGEDYCNTTEEMIMSCGTNW
jgi:hypothetical protein